VITIRDAGPDEALALEALQRRFVEPDMMRQGDVIANPNALGFYERVGFVTTGEAATRFGNAPRMTLELEAS